MSPEIKELQKINRNDLCNLVACIVVYTISFWEETQNCSGLDDILFLIFNTKFIFYNQELESMMKEINYIKNNKPKEIHTNLSEWKGPIEYDFHKLRFLLENNPHLCKKFHYLANFTQRLS